MPVRVGKRVEKRVRKRAGQKEREIGREGEGDWMDEIRKNGLMKERDKNMTLDKSVSINHSTIKILNYKTIKESLSVIPGAVLFLLS